MEFSAAQNVYIDVFIPVIKMDKIVKIHKIIIIGHINEYPSGYRAYHQMRFVSGIRLLSYST